MDGVILRYAIKRINEVLGKGQGEDNNQQPRKDYETAHIDEGEYDTLDKWENELKNDVFSIDKKNKIRRIHWPIILIQVSQINQQVRRLTKTLPRKMLFRRVARLNFQIIKTKPALPRTPTSHVQNQNVSNELSNVENYAIGLASDIPASHGETPGSQ